MQPVTITRSGSDGDEEFHSAPGTPFVPGDNNHDSEGASIDAPTHPVRSMQRAFEESIVESADESTSNPSHEANAEVRRQTLLESRNYDGSWQKRWNQRPTAKHHPLLKLVSQIVFGLHLLQVQQAKSEGEVVKILQSHVNEVDSFLERTAEDFNLAITDIDERIRHLKLPMEHKDVFEVMLDDKKFRTQLLDGNDKIESIIDRTTKAMEASLYDLQEGTKANKELGRYLDSVHEQWPKEKRVIAEVFSAMRGNEHGWTRYIVALQSKAATLRQNLLNLGVLLGEMSKMAATASRRNASQSQITAAGARSAPTSPGLQSKFPSGDAPPLPIASSPKVINKPLPREPPAPALNGISKNTPRQQQVPMADRFERPRQSSQSNGTVSSRKESEPQRPRTAGATPARTAREADSRGNTADLAAFLKGPDRQTSHQNPLRSNPPDSSHSRSLSSKSKNNGAVDIMQYAEQARAQMGTKGRDSTSTTRTSSEPGSDRKQTLNG
jgi:hypothetical protein